ncbi:MAG: hypothetical protein ACM3MK_11830 [Chitinophagales bacterium]
MTYIQTVTNSNSTGVYAVTKLGEIAESVSSSNLKGNEQRISLPSEPVAWTDKNLPKEMITYIRQHLLTQPTAATLVHGSLNEQRVMDLIG